mgnify:CR=1 FL=1
MITDLLFSLPDDVVAFLFGIVSHGGYSCRGALERLSEVLELAGTVWVAGEECVPELMEEFDGGGLSESAFLCDGGG